MKKLDKIIQNVIITILIAAFCVLAIKDIRLAKEVIVFIVIVVYFFFIVAHAFLLIPLAALGMVVSDFVRFSDFYIKIKEKSDFLAWWTITIPFIVAVVIIYYIIPVLTCMLYLETFSIQEGMKQFGKIIRS